MNDPAGRFGALESHTCTADGARQRRDGLILTDDALMQLLLHRHELLGFRLGELEHRNARALRDHLGDHILIDDHTDVGFALTPGLLFLFALSLKLLLLVAKLGGLLELLVS